MLRLNRCNNLKILYKYNTLVKLYSTENALPKIEKKKPLGGAQLFFRSLLVFGAIGGATLWATQDSKQVKPLTTGLLKEKKLPDYGTWTIPQISQFLEKNQVSFAFNDAQQFSRSSGVYTPVVRYDNNSVPSNSPIEDYHTEQIYGGRLLFNVFDGHAGRDCARILSKYMSSYVFSELASSRETKQSVSDTVTALKRAFQRLDDDIVFGAISLPDPSIAQLSGSVVEQTRGKAQLVANALSGPLAGSCAISALVEGNNLFVACTGDSRVVLGRERIDGQLEAVPLTQDQTVRNTAEMRRMMEEHPGEERELFKRNRVLGGLMPTRAFGDARYKWSAAVQDALFTFIPLRRKSPEIYLTPPYVTAEPVVTFHPLSKSDKFMVLASDGLYDELSNEEIVGLVGESLRLQKEPNADLQNAAYRSGRFEWTYVDKNAATLLIRNALGGRDIERTGKLLAMPYPVSRDHRDDITVTVVFFDVDASQPDLALPMPSPSYWSYIWPFYGGGQVPNGFSAVDLSLGGPKKQKLQDYVNMFLQEKQRLLDQSKSQ